ncbi:MAG: site-specific integrase [Pseudomonadota bacterium]
MATIARIKRKSGVSYQAKIKRRGRILKTKTFRTKKAAREWSIRIESDLQLEAAHQDPGRRTRFQELCDKYVDHWTGSDHHRMTQVKWWRERLGNPRLSEIEVDQIRISLKDYRSGRDRNPAQERAPSTTNRMKAALSSMFTFAIKEGLAIRNPVRMVPGETERNHIIRYLSDEERLALLAACKESELDRLYLLVLMAIMTGARKGELLGIRWEKVDLVNRRVELGKTKNGDSRTLSLPFPVVEELFKFRKMTGFVFESPIKAGVVFDPKKVWDKALKRAGIENFRFHDLRHTAASYLAMGGASLLEVAEVLGHKSVQTTKRYAHLSIEHKQEVTDRIFGGIELGS